VIPERATCITCSDQAVTVVVVSLVDGDAVVDAGGSVERVAIDLVPDARPGDSLLCHAGIALSRVEGVAP
jgi:hydrogenase expression/formation protein HypC